MTYAARIGELRRAFLFHVLGSRGRYPHDFDIWSATQTRLYRTRAARALAYRRNPARVAGPTVSLVDGFRAAVQSPHGALLVAPSVPLAAHMECGLVPSGFDWSGFAETVASGDVEHALQRDASPLRRLRVDGDLVDDLTLHE